MVEWKELCQSTFLSSKPLTKEEKQIVFSISKMCPPILALVILLFLWFFYKTASSFDRTGMSYIIALVVRVNTEVTHMYLLLEVQFTHMWPLASDWSS